MPWTAVRLPRDVYSTLEDLQRRYGDTFTLPAPRVPMILTSDPRAVQEVFAAPPGTFGRQRRRHSRSWANTRCF
jgi:hypothetical protein